MATEFVSVTEAAASLNLNVSRVRLLCTQGRIKGARKIGNNWVIPAPVVIQPVRKEACC